MTDNDNAMAVPENLPALIRGEMKHGSLNGSYFELDDTDSENEPLALIANKQAGQADPESEDSKSFKRALNIESGFHEDDMQPKGKRGRLKLASVA